MRASDGFETAASLLPEEIQTALRRLSQAERRETEEIRLRPGFPPSVRVGRGERSLPGAPVTAVDLARVLETATRASAHTALASVSSGFVTVRGGVRLGLCGQAVMKDGEVAGLRSVGSICIRVPSQRPGCAAGVWPALTEGGFADTLIISPPGGGKTTLLRELCRLLSESGTRVAVADERGEIAGAWEGEAAFELGGMTDVITGAPKGRAAMMLLRSMAPEVIAMDEVSTPEDAAALEAASGCGVTVLATAHARSPRELTRRPAYARLMDLGLFRRVVTVVRTPSGRVYEVEKC